MEHPCHDKLYHIEREYWGAYTIWQIDYWHKYVECGYSWPVYVDRFFAERKYRTEQSIPVSKKQNINQRIRDLEKKGDVFGSALLKGLFKDL